MNIEMTQDQALIVFSALADEVYRTSSCIAPANRNQKRIDIINELRKRLGIQLLNLEVIDLDYLRAVGIT